MTKFKKVLGDAKVFYRILPSENPDWENMRISQDKKAIQIHYVGPRIEKKSGQRLFKQFETDGILVNISQNDVYTTVMDGVLESVFQGQNAIIVSFGQTGSGKSLTVGGLHFFYQDRGLIPRSIENIFRLKEQLPKHLEMEIEISYIEIMSMAQAHDLLKPYPAHLNKNNIKRTLKKLKVCKDLEALQIVFMAEGRKEYTCDTNYPSHVGSSIFTFHFTLRNMDFSDSYRVDSKLHIIDLAGNDCFGDKSSRFKDSWQVGVANRTKSYIEHFMLLLCGNDLELQRVQERTNIISEYLSNTFSRHSLLRFIGHLKSEKNIDPHLSISMLRFGQMVKNLKPEGTTVSIKPNELKIADTLQAELCLLKKKNIISEMLQNKEPKAPLCSDKTKQIQRLVEDFVKNQIDEINLFSLGNIAVIVRIMRDKIVSCEEEKAKLNNLLTETAESKINKSEGGTILEKTSSFKFVPTIISKPDNGQLQTVPQITSAKDLVKNSHSKKNVLQSKSHKKESMENDSKSISKKGRISSSSLNGPKRSSTLSKKKIGGVADSITSAEKTDKKKASENQQPTSALLNTANSILPDTTPERQDAMREYILSDKTMYKTAMEIFTKYDNEARNIYENYLKEIKTLNGLFEILELRKHELVQSKLVRQFSRKEEFDGDGNVVKSELEIKCHENINQAEQKVIKQQEIVLNLQAELKLLLAMRQQQRDEVKAEFEEFCKEKYNLPTPNLDDINETVFENEVPFEELCEQVEVDRMIENVTQEAVYVEIYKNFKHLMFNEAKRKAMFLRKSIKWIENTRQQIPTTTNT